MPILRNDQHMENGPALGSLKNSPTKRPTQSLATDLDLGSRAENIQYKLVNTQFVTFEYGCPSISEVNFSACDHPA
jgi:hypothetical protein